MLGKTGANGRRNGHWVATLAVGLASAAHGIGLEGPLPGQYGIDNRFAVSGAAPGSRVHLVMGTVADSTELPGCPGVFADVAPIGVHKIVVGTADASGNVTFNEPIPDIALDRVALFQAVEVGRCMVSEPVSFTFARHPMDDEIQMNHVQMKGTHNSYHIEPAVPFDPSHEYTHLPLDDQLELQGVRAFELDLHRHPTGWRVYHISVIDAQSTCRRFVDCLTTIESWSEANPDHVPIIVWIEVKDDTGGLPIDDLAPVDEIIRNNFPGDRLLTPDDVRGTYGSVRDALETDGWPTLGEVRGRVMFVLLNTDDKTEDYTDGYTTLEGRAMFANSESDQFGQPWVSVTKPGPSNFAVIQEALDDRMLVAGNICSADESDEQCAEDLATGLANGLTMLKDDFPGPVDGRDYWMDFEGGNPLVCNPWTATPDCNSLSVEDLP